MLKRWPAWVLTVILVAAGMGLLLWTTDTAWDRRAWIRYRAELAPGAVIRLEVGHDNPVALTEEEKGRAVALLQQARFERSNRVGTGPTPETILTLHFANGRTDHIGFWGGETFELRPHHLDPRSQLLVTSPALGEMIRLKLVR